MVHVSICIPARPAVQGLFVCSWPPVQKCRSDLAALARKIISIARMISSKTVSIEGFVMPACHRSYASALARIYGFTEVANHRKGWVALIEPSLRQNHTRAVRLNFEEIAAAFRLAVCFVSEPSPQLAASGVVQPTRQFGGDPLQVLRRPP